MKKVSVIIPFYSRKDWLYEAVESAIAQTYSNIEIIVVNDGSKEDITDFLDYYNDKIKYYYQLNQGVAAARNFGISVATGDYIAFLDSDDIWLPEKLEIQIAFMQRSGAKWSHTGFYYWYPENNRLSVIDNGLYYGDVKKIFYVTMKVATPSIVVERSIFEENPEIRFPVEFKKGQDTQLYRAIANIYPIALIQEPLLKVRMRSDNSYKQAHARFRTNALAYRRFKHDPNVPSLAKAIMGYYKFGYSIIGNSHNAIKEKIALALWVLPYVIERVYSKYLMLTANRDKKYLCVSAVKTKRDAAYKHLNSRNIPRGG